MSVRIMAEVWDCELPSAQKFVLLSMADHANDEGENAYPSVARLAKRCSLDPRTIQRVMRGLESTGHLVVQRAARQHSPTSYRVCPRGGITPDRHYAGPAMDPPGAALRPARGGVVPPNPSGTIKNRPKEKLRARRCPGKFELTPDLIAYAVAKGMPPDSVRDQLEAFRDHEFKDPHSDWPATWRTWARNFLKYNAQRGPSRSEGERFNRNSRAPVEPTRGAESHVVTSEAAVREYQERRKREREAAGGGT